jgi:hypothetical protein
MNISSSCYCDECIKNKSIDRAPAYWIIFTKISSGRFVLTVIAAICFLVIVIKMMNILGSKIEELDTGQILLFVSNLALVIQNVFNSYFTKKRGDSVDGDTPGKTQ